MNEQFELDHFRLLVIDGSELGPDLNGGRLVCINGTGDTPLERLTIDPSKCEPTFAEVPVVLDVPQQLALAAPVPEPSTWLMLAVGLAAVLKRRRLA